jgi:hypothetical protein
LKEKVVEGILIGRKKPANSSKKAQKHQQPPSARMIKSRASCQQSSKDNHLTDTFFLLLNQ